MSKIVTFEQAKRLKYFGLRMETKHGFHQSGDEFSIASYNLQEWWDYRSSKSDICRPYISDALDWIREEKDIACSVHLMIKLDDDSNKLIADNYSWEFWTKDDGINIDFVRYTHPLASSALLDAVLTYLEQKEQK